MNNKQETTITNAMNRHAGDVRKVVVHWRKSEELLACPLTDEIGKSVDLSNLANQQTVVNRIAYRNLQRHLGEI